MQFGSELTVVKNTRKTGSRETNPKSVEVIRSGNLQEQFNKMKSIIVPVSRINFASVESVMNPHDGELWMENQSIILSLVIRTFLCSAFQITQK